MAKVIRRGVKVRYIGDAELLQGKTFNVIQKSKSGVEIFAPIKLADGTIRSYRAIYPLNEFEIAEV